MSKKYLRVPSRTIEKDGRSFEYVDIYVLPGWDNRSFSSSQAQAADAIGLDQRCSAGGWIAGQGQDLLERLAV